MKKQNTADMGEVTSPALNCCSCGANEHQGQQWFCASANDKTRNLINKIDVL